MKPTKTLVSTGIAWALALSPLVLADDDDSDSDSDKDKISFEVAEVFFELNNTDGDLGIHALIDGMELESETEIRHAMPAPPAAKVNGLSMARPARNLSLFSAWYCPLM